MTDVHTVLDFFDEDHEFDEAAFREATIENFPRVDADAEAGAETEDDGADDHATRRSRRLTRPATVPVDDYIGRRLHSLSRVTENSRRKPRPSGRDEADQQYSTADDGIDGVSNAIINPSDRDSMHRW